MTRIFSFESSQIFPIVIPDLDPVAQDVVQYFESQGYRSSSQHTPVGGRLVSIYKGATFKTVLGRQTALNIGFEPTNVGTLARVGLGIFAQQGIPPLVESFVGWPVLLAQIWGLVQQNNLDEEALACLEQALIERSRTAPAAGATATQGPVTQPGSGQAETVKAGKARFCMNCGGTLQASDKFCSVCGTAIAPA